MAYSVILGIVIVALVVAGVIGSFWSAGEPDRGAAATGVTAAPGEVTRIAHGIPG